MRLAKYILADLRHNFWLTLGLLFPLRITKLTRWNLFIMVPRCDDHGWYMISLNGARKPKGATYIDHRAPNTSGGIPE